MLKEKKKEKSFTLLNVLAYLNTLQSGGNALEWPLLSYIEDTTHFINKVRNLKLNKDTYLITLDVSSFYTNIPYNEGIESCIYFLQKYNVNNILACQTNYL
jgi:hypothetical protein